MIYLKKITLSLIILLILQSCSSIERSMHEKSTIPVTIVSEEDLQENVRINSLFIPIPFFSPKIGYGDMYSIGIGLNSINSKKTCFNSNFNIHPFYTNYLNVIDGFYFNKDFKNFYDINFEISQPIFHFKSEYKMESIPLGGDGKNKGIRYYMEKDALHFSNVALVAGGLKAYKLFRYDDMSSNDRGQYVSQFYGLKLGLKISTSFGYKYDLTSSGATFKGEYSTIRQFSANLILPFNSSFIVLSEYFDEPVEYIVSRKNIGYEFNYSKSAGRELKKGESYGFRIAYYPYHQIKEFRDVNFSIEINTILSLSRYKRGKN